MFITPRAQAHKVIPNRGTKALRKKDRNSLTKEIVDIWDRKIPAVGRTAIWASVLSCVNDCLLGGDYQDHGLFEMVSKATRDKDLKSVIAAKTLYGSPLLYGNSDHYLRSVVVANLFAKTEQTISGLDPLAKAVERFHEAERLCGISNRRLRHYRSFDHCNRPIFKDIDVHGIFHVARLKIARWLGDVNVDDILDRARHGPGGVVGLKRPMTTPYFKFAKSGYTVTRGAYWLAVRAIASSDAWVRALGIDLGLIQEDTNVVTLDYNLRVKIADASLTIVDENEVTFVNKDALTKRSISIESELGVYIQLGIGALLKERLRAAGCDLSDQTRNQELARIGSIEDGDFDPVTIDERMASDTGCIEIYRELLPEKWFNLMDSLRSHFGTFRGEVFKWKKFSSMGNGFTFELESLIFYALAQACSDTTGTSDWFQDTFGKAYRYAYVSVFGDDIIIPKRVAATLIKVLRYSGFQTNSEKSFVDGPFRESCGKDYWNGVDVRPFFFKRGLTNVRDLIHLHNGLKDVMERTGLDLKKVLDHIRLMIPNCLEKHLRGVEKTVGDEFLWVTPDESHLSSLVEWHISWQRWTYPALRMKPRVRQGQLRWRYVQFLYAATSRKYESVEISCKPSNDDFLTHFLAGGSRGDVVESGGGISVLTQDTDR